MCCDLITTREKREFLNGFDLHRGAFAPTCFVLGIFPEDDALAVVETEPGRDGIAQRFAAGAEIVVIEFTAAASEAEEVDANDRSAASALPCPGAQNRVFPRSARLPLGDHPGSQRQAVDSVLRRDPILDPHQRRRWR